MAGLELSDLCCRDKDDEAPAVKSGVCLMGFAGVWALDGSDIPASAFPQCNKYPGC